VSFNGADGAEPNYLLTIDAAGDLFGTTPSGGANGDGTVFEIIKTSGTYATSPTTLLNFNGTDGGGSGLIPDAAGDLFGETTQVGETGAGPFVGTVFELTNTGFVICFLAGTRIATPGGEVSVEQLAVDGKVVTQRGEARRIVWIGTGRVLATRAGGTLQRR
jgi:Hint domain